jgi:DNA-binding SARP family transcriptional activator
MNTRDSYSGGSLRAGYSRQFAAAAVKHAREDIEGETYEGLAAATSHDAVRTADAVPKKASGRKGAIPATQREGGRVSADHVPGVGQIVSPLPTASLPNSRLEGYLSLDLAKLPKQPAAEAKDAAVADQGQGARVIRRKLMVPDTPVGAEPRERLDGLLRRRVDAHRVVAVTATAGAGKSVAVAHASRKFDRPVAWLSVDATDAIPGRLLTYLEEALATQLPWVRGIATGALAAGIPAAEAAGLLVEAASDAQVVFVLDDLERLHESVQAWQIIASMVRYAPPSMRLILISRRALPCAVWPSPAFGDEVARLVDGDLAFTVQEAHVALRLRHGSAADATAAVAATGGCVTGVLLDARLSTGHVCPDGGGRNNVADYVAAHILGEVDVQDRAFLISTSVLEEVTVESALALGIDDAAGRLSSLQSAPIPAQWSPESGAMRCHPRFREHLRELLDHRGRAAVCELRAAYGRSLAGKGFHEKAVGELLAAGALSDALTSAKHAILGVIGRRDFAVADRWIAALSQVVQVDDVGFADAQLMLAAARDDMRDGARIADELAEAGRREQLAATSEGAAALMGWCYGFTGRLEEARAVLDAAPDGPGLDVARYALALFDEPGAGPARPEPTGGPLDGLLYSVDYLVGRLRELAGDPPSPCTATAMGPGRIGALRATGRTAAALQEYEAARCRGFFAKLLESFIGPDVLLDAGRVDEARAALARGHKLARASGSPAWVAFHHIAAAKLALRADRDTTSATAALLEIDSDPVARGYPLVREWAQTWLGLAALLEDDDAAALSSLRVAVTGMRASERILELPTAAVYLAEAEWRAGNQDAADHAADVALDAARQQGSNHVLLQALADFPAVVARRIDAEAHADSPWHDVGRALAAQGVAVGTRIPTAIELVEFGRTEIILDGTKVRPRIAKCYELLGFLAARNGAPVSRDELLNALFDARDDESARAYLRQTITGVRRLLPADAMTTSKDGRIGLSPDVVVGSESARLEAELAVALRLQGGELVDAAEQALEVLSRGDYFPGVGSAWVDERRQQLAELATTVRAAAADAAYAADRYPDAQRLAEAVLAADPLREATWRTSMRVRSAAGDYDGVITTFAQCERALGAVGTRPTATTRALLDQLRR